MTNTRWAAAGTGLTLLLAACTTGSTPPGPTPSLSSTTSPSSATSSPTVATTTSPEDLATARAEEVTRAYYRAIPQCLFDPAHALVTCFDGVAIGTELKNRRNALSSAQQMQTRASGDISLLEIKRKSVDLTSKVNETPPTVPTVTFTVCTDVSRFNIVDKDGKSIVPPDRKPHVLVDLLVYNYKFPDPGQWRVGYVEQVKDATC